MFSSPSIQQPPQQGGWKPLNDGEGQRMGNALSPWRCDRGSAL